MKKYLLEISVFICGAVVMILELVGSRVVAPYIGTSIHVWTSLIGVILACLSIGYWFGGRIADRYPTYRAYAAIIFLSGIAVGITAISQTGILAVVHGLAGSVQARAVLNAILLFAPASILLGMISPYAVKLRMQELASSGQTVGRLYAISTIGSIVGTFLAGFWLISLFGSRYILYVLALTLIVLSTIFSLREYLRIKFGIMLFLVTLMGFTRSAEVFAVSQGFVSMDTLYSHVTVSESTDTYSGRPIRILKTSADAIQSGMYLDDADALVFPYTKYYRLAGFFRPDLTRALIIGGGAYSYPKDFLRSFPSSTLDVVEIDPALTQLAREYFHLPGSPRLHIVHEDGRTFINREEGKYQTMFIDAFQSLTPPFHLMTQEAVQHLSNSLDDRGVVIVNLVSAIEGDEGKLARAVYRTYASVFPHVSIFLVQHPEDGAKVQNIMLIAEKSQESKSLVSKNSEFAEYFTHRYTKPISEDVPVLTDDFAPVEEYVKHLRD